MCSLTLDQPRHDLDPLAPAHLEGDQLTKHGPLVPVNLYGGVRAWAATDLPTARTIFEGHPQLSKNPEHWDAYTRGEVPADWPLLSLVIAESMLNTDGTEHHRNVYMRYATQDTVISGVTVRRGEPILVALATANRDGAAFDLNAQPTSHLAFGAGPHFCLGATLARLEGEIALRELFTRFPGLRVAVPEAELTALISPAINGLTALPVTVD